MESFYSRTRTSWSLLDDVHSKFESLGFPSHEASKNCPYYAAARIMQYYWLKQKQDLNNTVSQDCVENNYWTTLLFTVMHGINKSECVHQNVYIMGISGLLLTCILRFTSMTSKGFRASGGASLRGRNFAYFADYFCRMHSESTEAS